MPPNTKHILDNRLSRSKRSTSCRNSGHPAPLAVVLPTGADFSAGLYRLLGLLLTDNSERLTDRHALSLGRIPTDRCLPARLTPPATDCCWWRSREHRPGDLTSDPKLQASIFWMIRKLFIMDRTNGVHWFLEMFLSTPRIPTKPSEEAVPSDVSSSRPISETMPDSSRKFIIGQRRKLYLIHP